MDSLNILSFFLFFLKKKNIRECNCGLSSMIMKFLKSYAQPYIILCKISRLPPTLELFIAYV